MNIQIFFFVHITHKGMQECILTDQIKHRFDRIDTLVDKLFNIFILLSWLGFYI